MQMHIKKRLKNKTALNFWFDLVLLALFVLTGITAYVDKQLHEIVGIMMTVAVLVHLGLHWSWITAMLSRIRKVKPAMRLKVILDMALLVVYLLLFLSGLIIMLIWAPAVSHFHTWMFYSFLGLVSAHMALNGKWLHSQAKRRFVQGAKQRSTASKQTA